MNKEQIETLLNYWFAVLFRPRHYVLYCTHQKKFVRLVKVENNLSLVKMEFTERLSNATILNKKAALFYKKQDSNLVVLKIFI